MDEYDMKDPFLMKDGEGSPDRLLDVSSLVPFDWFRNLERDIKFLCI